MFYRILITLTITLLFAQQTYAVGLCKGGGLLKWSGSKAGCIWKYRKGITSTGMNNILGQCKGATVKSSKSLFLFKGKKLPTCIVCVSNSNSAAKNALLNSDYEKFSPELSCLEGPKMASAAVGGPVKLANAYVGYRLCLQTYDGEHFVSVRESDNRFVRAEATNCNVLERMDFSVSNTGDPANPEWSDGKPVPAQGLVRIQNATGAYLIRNNIGGLQGNNESGDDIRVMFRVNRVETGPGLNTMGGFLKAGDVVTLRSEASGQYIVAENGGGGEVNANRGKAVTWERFRLVKP